MQRIATCRHFNIRERRRSPATAAAHSAERAERKRRGTSRTSAAARRLETGGAPKPPAPAESPPPAKSPTAKVTGKVSIGPAGRTHAPYTAEPSAPSPSPAQVKSPAATKSAVAQQTCGHCSRHLVPSLASHTPFVNGTCDGREHAGAMRFAPGDTVYLCPTALVSAKAHCNFAVCTACHSPGGPHSVGCVLCVSWLDN
jgi:hypothetical protein